MAQEVTGKITHVDMELMRTRISLSPGQRIQAMLDARAIIVGFIRGRLRKRHPDISEAELNLKLLEEIERAQNIRPWSQSISRYPTKT